LRGEGRIVLGHLRGVPPLVSAGIWRNRRLSKKKRRDLHWEQTAPRGERWRIQALAQHW
jgi:hypothetical protein